MFFYVVALGPFFLDVQGKKRTFSQKKDVGNNLANITMYIGDYTGFEMLWLMMLIWNCCI